MPKVIQPNYIKYIKSNRNLRLIGISASVMLTAIMTLAVFPLVKPLGIAEAAPGDSVSSSTYISMSSGSPSSVDLALSIAGSSTGASFAESTDEQKAKFMVSTNNYTGYTLTIAGKDDTQKLINGTNYLESINTVLDRTTFDTDTYNGKWGFKPSKYNSTDNVGFWPAPTASNPSTLDVTKVANTSTSNEYTLSLGARVDSSVVSGTYTGTFVLAATANPVTYTINFKDNTGDTSVSNIPSYPLTGSTTSTTLVLPPTIPTRTGYNFAYWCLGTVSDNGTTCSGTHFNPSANFGIDQTTSDVVDLYATWTNNSYGITIKPVTGVESVSLNGTVCTDATTGCTIANLEGGKSYVLTATIADGYTFNGWSNTNTNATIADTTSTGAVTTYTVDGSTDTITPSATANTYVVTIKTIAGVSSVSLNGQSCASESGCSVSNLEYGKSYSLVATPANGYQFTMWNSNNSGVGTGTFANINAANTNYTVYGEATITPDATNCLIYGSMQSPMYTCGDATTTPIGSAGPVIDSRDNQGYYVAKLADEKIWMVQNLKLGKYSTSLTLNSSTSDVPSGGFTLNNKLSNGAFPHQTIGGVEWQYNGSAYYCTEAYGCYYNWYTATAGTGTTSVASGDVSNSICPKGWTLPTQSEFATLATAYGGTGETGARALLVGNTAFTENYNGAYKPGLLLGGNYGHDGARNVGTYGHYWARTAGSTQYGYDLYLNTTAVGPAGYGNKYIGFSVRCVLK